MQTTDELTIVMCAVPLDRADDLAHVLLERHLAACVQRVGPVLSTYRWDGRLEQSNEVLLLIKTTSARAAAVASTLAERHPYEVPEILSVPVNAAWPSYLRWVLDQTAAG